MSEEYYSYYSETTGYNSVHSPNEIDETDSPVDIIEITPTKQMESISTMTDNRNEKYTFQQVDNICDKQCCLLL